MHMPYTCIVHVYRSLYHALLLYNERLYRYILFYIKNNDKYSFNGYILILTSLYNSYYGIRLIGLMSLGDYDRTNIV